LLGLNPELVPDASKQDGINAARRTLPLCVFHPRTEESGFAALEQYRREWDDEKKAYRQSEVHDWASHPSDSFRYLSLSWKRAPTLKPRLSVPSIRSNWTIPPPVEPRRREIRL
jgi:hypothetical protein